MEKLPRGLRNNNPLNIRHSADKFVGEITGYDPHFDTDFKRFKSAAFGYRAACCIIRTYLLRGYITVEAIINRWCPDDTAGGYLDAVCKFGNFRASELIKYYDRDQVIRLVSAMSYVENGRPAIAADVVEGYKLSMVF